MANTKFTIGLELDGGDVQGQAAQIRKQIEGVLAEGFSLKINARGVGAVTKMTTAIADNATKLKRASAVFDSLQQLDPAQLKATQTAVAGIVREASKIFQYPQTDRGG